MQFHRVCQNSRWPFRGIFAEGEAQPHSPVSLSPFIPTHHSFVRLIGLCVRARSLSLSLSLSLNFPTAVRILVIYQEPVDSNNSTSSTSGAPTNAAEAERNRITFPIGSLSHGFGLGLLCTRLTLHYTSCRILKLLCAALYFIGVPTMRWSTP